MNPSHLGRHVARLQQRPQRPQRCVPVARREVGARRVDVQVTDPGGRQARKLRVPQVLHHGHRAARLLQTDARG